MTPGLLTTSSRLEIAKNFEPSATSPPGQMLQVIMMIMIMIIFMIMIMMILMIMLIMRGRGRVVKHYHQQRHHDHHHRHYHFHLQICWQQVESQDIEFRRASLVSQLYSQ